MTIADRVPANVLKYIVRRREIPGLAITAIGNMTDLDEVILLAQVLRQAVAAYSEQVAHMIDVEADPDVCRKCADFLAWPFGREPCGAWHWWQQQIDAAWRIA